MWLRLGKDCGNSYDYHLENVLYTLLSKSHNFSHIVTSPFASETIIIIHTVTRDPDKTVKYFNRFFGRNITPSVVVLMKCSTRPATKICFLIIYRLLECVDFGQF